MLCAENCGSKLPGLLVAQCAMRRRQHLDEVVQTERRRKAIQQSQETEPDKTSPNDYYVDVDK